MKNKFKPCHTSISASLIDKLSSILFFPLQARGSEGIKYYPYLLKSQKGRSMVEMLGVLAIVGVLSVGALAGYSKAMFRHKMNQTIDQATKIFQRFEEIKERDWGATNEDLLWIDNAEAAVKFGLLEKCNNPSEVEGTTQGCQLPIGYVSFDLAQEKNNSAGCGNGTWGNIHFAFTDSKSCNAFLSVHWEHVLPIDWWGAGRSVISLWKSGHLYDGNTPLTMNKITDVCTTCGAQGYCLITFTYRGYC